MSKAVKQSIIILILLVLGSLGFALYSMMDAQKAKDEGLRLGQELSATQDREKKAVGDIKRLKGDLDKLVADRDDLANKVKKAEKKVEELYSQITEITQDRDNIQSQIDSVAKERDSFVAKVKDLEDQLAKKQAEMASAAPKTASIIEPTPSVAVSSSNDEYWASVLKDKASLEVKLENLNQDLTKKSAEIVDLKQSTTDLKVKLEGMEHDKNEIENEIKYKSDLVNNLSLELARTKNDKKFSLDRVKSLNEENAGLRQQIKQLVTTKGALEKSVLKVTQDRNDIQRKLGQTETMVQSKIDEIWDIKDSLDESLDSARAVAQPSEVELSPIVVSSDDRAVNFNAGMATPGLNGKVVSINKDNNFVIVDIGESQGIRIGDTLNVYRDTQYIARLEVIQVRKDISAADIKDQSTAINAGDIVR